MAKKGISSSNSLSLDDMTVTPKITTSSVKKVKTAPSSEKTVKSVKSATPKSAPEASTPGTSGKLPKSVLDVLNTNLTRYNGNSEKGKPVYLPVALIERLQELSNRHYKRLSARALAAAILDTILNTCNSEEILDIYMESIHYVPPTAEEIKARNVAAEKAKAARAARAAKK